MYDRFGRAIDYMRLSITDRCNLRCRYCMPHGVAAVSHEDILTFEEFLSIAKAATQIGICHFKVTGGEPLVRRGCVEFLRNLKQLPGVQSVTLTTNGVLLAPLAQTLACLGLDGVNISLDTCDAAQFAAITGTDALASVLDSIDACVRAGLRTKLNCVLLDDSLPRLPALAAFAQERPIDVRFIEMMPIGNGASTAPVQRPQALEALRGIWPDLSPVCERRGNGPAHYYASRALQGRIGFIDAVSHRFCAQCNRVRITSTGVLKPCLCYSEGVDLRTIVRTCPAQLPSALRRAVYEKPRAHCFDQPYHITEQKAMSQIGG